MAGDFGSGKGHVDSGNSNERSPKESGTPKTGFSKAPKGGKAEFGPGPGVPGSNRKIR